MQLFQQLKVGATDDSPDASLTCHAHSSIEGLPWYDVLLLEGRAQGGRLEYTLARLVAFVLVGVPPEAAAHGFEQEEHILAFTHVFCAPGTNGTVLDPYFPRCRVAAYQAGAPGSRLSARVTMPRFPIMQLASYHPGGSSSIPIARLVDTVSISSAVWTTPNLDRRDLYWVLREADKNERHPHQEEASSDCPRQKTWTTVRVRRRTAGQQAMRMMEKRGSNDFFFL